ncbi:MAG: molybdopterin molybdotransferase MoeA [Candidatus Methanoperedens sp.]|nr:molybdopterin molybdotransferase MoeA [Candidatus Methanoperedens sp.]MCZ7359486.1 molybdopterin molybdotransferase MoeA [Candidatus Methanoperedens sp.]HLB71663.1 gephyrin-like molybdotransferase Glp [Candidatus Methanoperedens sp.]
MMFRKRTNAEEAKRLFLKEIGSIHGTEILRIEECDGRVIAEDIVADTDVPHYRRAAMDGFAVRASDTLGAGRDAPVALKLGKNMEKGVCMRVHTGSPVPEGADAVVMLEDAAVHGDTVEIFAQIHPFRNVGEIGEDIEKGETIIKNGHKLRPCDIAVLASLGIDSIRVFRRPAVAIIPTGEELVHRGIRELKMGEVYETNGLMADLYIKKWGGITKLHDIVTDDPEKIKDAIDSNLDADMIIISGGTSVGKRDYVPGVVKEMGKLIAHGVGISPGKPTALGIIRGKPVVCMPGYPVAGIVALFYFARPGLRKLGNLPDDPDRVISAVLAEKIPSRTGYKTFVRVKIDNGRAVPLAVSGAGILSSVSKADGFVIIPENIEGLNAGEEVDVVLIE